MVISMNEKCSTVRISMSDKGFLKIYSKILGKPQKTIIHEFIEAISSPIAVFKSGSMVYETDYVRVTDSEPTLKIVFSGNRRLVGGIHHPTLEDRKRDKG